MNASLQRFWVLVRLSLAVAVGWVAGWGWGCATLALQSLVLALGFVQLRWVNQPAPGWGDLLKAWAGEAVTVTFTFSEAPSGFTVKMDEKNHHLHKSVFIGEVKADGQFNVVWKTPGPVKAQPWSPYIPENKGKKDEPEKK